MTGRTIHLCLAMSAVSGQEDNLHLSGRVRHCEKVFKYMIYNIKIRLENMSARVRTDLPRRCWGGQWMEWTPLKGVHPGHRHTSSQHSLPRRGLSGQRKRICRGWPPTAWVLPGFLSHRGYSRPVVFETANFFGVADIVAVVVYANRSQTTVCNVDRRVGLGPISNFGNGHLLGEASDFCS